MSELDGWKYCPCCASELELFEDEGKAECKACGFRAYATSHPTASAVCLDGEGRVLLSRRAAEPFAGMWDLPGGFLAEGEEPLDCLRRELEEEASVQVEPERFLGVWVDRYGDGDDAVATLNLYWTVRISAGHPEPADDVAEFRWFACDEVPVEELAFAHTRDVLSAVWQQHA